jgi:hypothetical protein
MVLRSQRHQLTLSSINRESSAAVFVGKPIPWSPELLSKDRQMQRNLTIQVGVVSPPPRSDDDD